MNTNFYDELNASLSSGAKSAFTKDSPQGATITGTITDIRITEVTDFTTRQIQTWDDGTARKQIVITIDTPLREFGDDDGKRSIYVKLWGAQKQALQSALTARGYTRADQALVPGAKFTATYIGNLPPARPGLNGAKAYQYEVEAPDIITGMPANAAHAQTPPTPAPTAPTPTPAAPTPTAPAAPTPAAPLNPAEIAIQLINAGIDDTTIQTQTGLDPAIIQALRTTQQ